MPAASAEWHWLEAEETIAADELCRTCSISAHELGEMMGYGSIAPLRVGEPPLFGADWVMPLREAARLRRDFDLDIFAMGLLAQHLHRIEALERELRAMRARFGV